MDVKSHINKTANIAAAQARAACDQGANGTAADEVGTGAGKPHWLGSRSPRQPGAFSR